jgi:hypothetical protein
MSPHLPLGSLWAMTRRISRRLFLVLTLWAVGLLAGCATPPSPHLVTRVQREVGHAPAPLVHEPTGLVFPASIASAKRTGEVVTDAQTTAYYNDSARSVRAALTLMATDGSTQAAGEVDRHRLRQEWSTRRNPS